MGDRIAFSNAYMFGRVMLDEGICAAFLRSSRS